MDAELLENLAAFRKAVDRTEVLRTILSAEWFADLQQAIEGDPRRSIQTVDPSGILDEFSVPLALVGASDEKAWAFGGNPLNHRLRLTEARLTAFASLRFPRVEERLKEIRTKVRTSAFHDHLFEALALGDLALKGAFVDLSPLSQNVDGAIEIDGRRILVEITRTGDDSTTIPKEARRLGLHAYDVGPQERQVRNKVRKKVADGRQLALAGDQPGILFLGLNFHGARLKTALSTIRSLFQESDYLALSGVVASHPGNLMIATSFLASTKARVPLSLVELTMLKKWYGSRETR